MPKTIYIVVPSGTQNDPTFCFLLTFILTEIKIIKIQSIACEPRYYVQCITCSICPPSRLATSITQTPIFDDAMTYFFSYFLLHPPIQ